MSHRAEGIVALRNKDVEHIVNAAANVGDYAYGVTRQKRFAMLVMADIHRCAKQMHHAIEYLNEMDALDAGICLGDIQGSNFAENDGSWYSLALEWAEKPFYTVIGNHDCGNSVKREICATKEEAFNKFIRPNLKHIGIPDLDKTYYSVNFDEYKITLIVLDDYMTPDTLDENGDFRVFHGAECMNQEEIDWLIKTLSEVPEDYHVIIARHSYYDSAKITECSFTQPNSRFANPIHLAYGKCEIVSDIVNAWTKGTALNKVYAPESDSDILPTLVARADFSERGEGVFIAHLTGHMHWCIAGKSEAYPDQNIIAFPTAANDDWNNVDCDLLRERGTKAEDCLTAFAVDRDERKFHMVLVGANFTKNMTDRTHYSVSY